MWATETLRSCKNLVTSAADTWERFIWSENIWSEDFQRTEDQELAPDVHDTNPLSLQITTGELQTLPATSQKTPDLQNGFSGYDSVYDAHPLSRPNTTRVLQILPATSQELTDTISCRLSVVSLDPPFWPWAHNLLSIDYALDFRAVSYVWGPPSKTNFILVDGKPFTVRANLWNFLAQARRERFSGTLWIDAICINQADIEERSSQVANMSLIYSKAVNVWAWVGLGTEEHFSVFQHIAEIDWRAEVQRTQDQHEYTTIEQYLESIKLFFDLEYWSRLWIFQEYVLASCVTVQCGSEVLSGSTLDILAKAVGILTEAVGLLEWNPYGLFNSAGIRVLQLRFYHTERSHEISGAGAHLCFLIQESYLARAACADPHDHVYALLSLHGAARLEIIPDYTKHPLQLFIEVVEFLDRNIRADMESVLSMTYATILMQEKLGLNDCAEASQARESLTFYRLK
jgi:hypothetical protein